MAQPTTQVSFPIGVLPEFSEGADFAIYRERLELYFDANQLPEKKRKSVLLTAIGESTYKTVRDLCFPKLPTEKSYEELADILKKQYTQRVPIYRRRREFYALNQGDDSINEWYLKIKNAASVCDFKSSLDEILKDKFMSGLSEGSILDKLYEEAPEKEFDKLLEIALNEEAALRKYNTSSTVNRVAGVRCFACGKDNHCFKMCKFKKYTCKSCNKVGHLACVCKSKDKSNFIIKMDKTNADHVIANDNNHVFQIPTRSADPFLTDVVISGEVIQVEIDSGAGVLLLPYDLYKKRLVHVKLHQTCAKLCAYDGNSMETIGEVNVNIGYGKMQPIKGKFIITRLGCRPLLGRDLMKLLNMKIVVEDEPTDLIHEVSLPKKLTNLLDQYKEIFSEELGTYKYEKVSLKLSPDATPIFKKPRVVPYAFKEMLEKELDRLEEQGVISKSDNSKWGTPLVPIVKPNGALRVCADYKVTINKLSDATH